MGPSFGQGIQEPVYLLKCQRQIYVEQRWKPSYVRSAMTNRSQITADWKT